MSKLPPIQKSLGQHFLIDEAMIHRIIEHLAPEERWVEIGPGRGATDASIGSADGYLLGCH